jgi:hypothetical protein
MAALIVVKDWQLSHPQALQSQDNNNPFSVSSPSL